jgi:y4mF family transcriptional regulator
MNNLATFVRFQRKRLGITQAELAAKAGVGLRFIRELEQGKTSLQLDKVEQVLQLFGFQLTPAIQHIDAYGVFWQHLKKGVRITLANKTIKNGILLEELIDKKTRKIFAWRFIPNHHVIQYQQKPDDTLTETILHADILAIENQ